MAGEYTPSPHRADSREAAAQQILDEAKLARAKGQGGEDLFNEGLDAQEDGDHWAAIRSFSIALVLLPTDVDTLISRGNSYLELDYWSSASADYTSALRELEQMEWDALLHTVDGAGQQIASDRHGLLLGMLSRLRHLSALTTEGIFRVPGSRSDVDQLLVVVQAEGLLTQASSAALLGCSDVHTMASLLRAWLRSAPLIPPTAFAQFEQLALADDGSDQAATPVESCLSTLPAANQVLLRVLIGFLQHVDAASTKMTADSLGMVFAPTLLCRDGQDVMEMMKNIQNDGKVVSALVRSLPRREAAEEMDEIQDGRHAGKRRFPLYTRTPLPYDTALAVYMTYLTGTAVYVSYVERLR